MASLLFHVASGGNAVLRLHVTHAYASRTRLYPLPNRIPVVANIVTTFVFSDVLLR